MTTSDKSKELDVIASEIRSYKGLDIAKQATQAVPGEGNPDASIMFIGEAPGFNEDKLGRPFVGQAGKLLEKILQSAMGLSREEVYITNIVKFRPPNNRDPFDDEIEACRDWLDRQIQIIKPRVIVTLGRFSMAKFIPGVSISNIHGQARFVTFLGDKYLVFPMYHPAAALRAGTILHQFEEDFAKLHNLLYPAPTTTQSPTAINVGNSQLDLF